MNDLLFSFCLLEQGIQNLTEEMLIDHLTCMLLLEVVPRVPHKVIEPLIFAAGESAHSSHEEIELLVVRLVGALVIVVHYVEV